MKKLFIFISVMFFCVMMSPVAYGATTADLKTAYEADPTPETANRYINNILRVDKDITAYITACQTVYEAATDKAAFAWFINRAVYQSKHNDKAADCLAWMDTLDKSVWSADDCYAYADLAMDTGNVDLVISFGLDKLATFPDAVLLRSVVARAYLSKQMYAEVLAISSAWSGPAHVALASVTFHAAKKFGDDEALIKAGMAYVTACNNKTTVTVAAFTDTVIARCVATNQMDRLYAFLSSVASGMPEYMLLKMQDTGWFIKDAFVASVAAYDYDTNGSSLPLQIWDTIKWTTMGPQAGLVLCNDIMIAVDPSEGSAAFLSKVQNKQALLSRVVTTQ